LLNGRETARTRTSATKSTKEELVSTNHTKNHGAPGDEKDRKIKGRKMTHGREMAKKSGAKRWPPDG
jgi:hypothetical protein